MDVDNPWIFTWMHLDASMVVPTAMNSWIKCLSRAGYTKVNSSNSKWLSESDFYEGISENHIVSNIAAKVDAFALLGKH